MELRPIFEATRQASRALAAFAPAATDALLRDLADATEAQTPFLLAENARDLARMPTTDPRHDRLRLTAERLRGMADDLRNVAGLSTPLGQVISETDRPNGLHLTKVRVPLGVVSIIYEARPNVTFDSLALCLKTGNACLLKGGSDAAFSNAALLEVARPVLERHGLPAAVATLLPPDRAATAALLAAVGYVDVLIPRGSQQLINYVRENARVPVIETGAGIVHTYFDETGDLSKGQAIIHNAKTRRVSVCNSLDCLLLHASRLADLPELLAPLATAGVELFADAPALAALAAHYPASLLSLASEEHYGTEFLSLKMAVKTVGSLDEAMDHIAQHGSRHSEAIVSEDAAHIDTFLRTVDAAAVYANASTAFTDGAQFGLGAEIGISTQKLHARGPMGLQELTSYKWLVRGDGHIRTS
ncbi:glutamate-5-semialdehyde dehydrogenase [Hymenobacter sp. BT770]|uniref:glutamate-5-semialdehyde dehydrogenase n=1 Tax=Hymenobacter sp. BT770 TaxID=2886942 RepID=UPI001D101827|nr:glutamate-5-semialdehyde dehydrogenase [Hymenobacter sp. BT770]MCC3153248.1 glutamate-5-semialdehyde dehydrogenase [Hymenobacter sp. BT770]MDO3414243.1 glutamate-5-semialdehyde dehydrogenase [Hymenobacter sp. BT770]